jgi:DNA-binding response OmpR family regulator
MGKVLLFSTDDSLERGLSEVWEGFHLENFQLVWTDSTTIILDRLKSGEVDFICIDLGTSRTSITTGFTLLNSIRDEDQEVGILLATELNNDDLAERYYNSFGIRIGKKDAWFEEREGTSIASQLSRELVK